MQEGVMERRLPAAVGPRGQSDQMARALFENRK
jgi:hypothetical protein